MNSHNKTPNGYKLNRLLIEKKTRRVNLLLKPSTYAKGKNEAERQGISFNEFVNILIDGTSTE